MIMKYGALLVGLNIFAAMFSSTPPTIYKYRIYCVTEAQNVYEWNTVTPTTCPNNTAHTINPNSISIVDQRAPSITSIQQETVPTDGWFKTETFVINAATGPNVITTATKSWPFNISLINIYFQTTDANTGDEFIIDWAKNLTIGALTADISAGVTTAAVSTSVIQNSAVGFTVAFTDGTNFDNGGRIIAIDAINNSITFETATVHSYLASSPTAVQITVNPIDLVFGPPTIYNVAKNVIGASHIPANQVATAYYTNNSAEAKQLYVNLEYFY